MEAMAEHERLMAALAERDARLAGEILRQHDLGTALAIVAALQRPELRPEEAGVALASPDQ